MYVFYRNRNDSARELVLRDGAMFPPHLRKDDWYVHGTHLQVNGRTEADIEMAGYCDRSSGVTFGHRLAAHARPQLIRRPSL